MDEKRIINLEIKFLHQEDFIQQLNETVVAQQAALTRLEKDILDLKRSVNSENGVQGSRTLLDDKPPHY